MVTTDSPVPGHAFEQTRIGQLPINGRQVMNLMWTIPGLMVGNNGDLRGHRTRVGTHDVVLEAAKLRGAQNLAAVRRDLRNSSLFIPRL